MSNLRIVIIKITTGCLLLLAIMLGLSKEMVLAQEAATTTPAPSKTPTPTALASNSDLSTQVSFTPAPFIEPFTQSDLTILTGNVQRPNGLTWHDDKLYVSCAGDWTLYEIDAETGSTAQFIYGIRNAHTIFADVEGEELNLWIPDFQNNNLIFVRRGVPSTVVSGLDGPWGIDQIDAEHFAVTSLLGDRLVSVNRNGTSRNVLTGLRSPGGVVVGDEFTFVANTGSARRAIEWFENEMIFAGDEPLDSAEEAVGHSLVSGLQNTTNLTMGDDGYLYFSYALGTRGVVGRVNPEVCIGAGGCSNEQVEIVVYTELAAPLSGLTITPDMRLFVHSIFSPDIYWVDLSSTQSQDSIDNG